MRAFIERLEKNAKYLPNRQAVVDEQRSVTYSELFRRTDQWAHLLSQKFGIQSGDKVMILMKNSTAYMETIIALIKLDAVAIPLNYHNLFGVQTIYQRAECKLLITERDMDCGTIPGYDQMMTMEVEDMELELSEHSTLPTCWGSSTGERELLFFTSGTTGTPKGIVVTHRNFFIDVPENYFSESTVNYLMIRPLFFRSHLTLATTILSDGNTILLLRDPEPSGIYDMTNLHSVSHMISGPTDLMEMVTWLNTHGKTMPNCLQEVMTTGRSTSYEFKKNASRYFPEVLFIDFYGTSEAGGISSTDSMEWLEKEQSAGRPDFFVTVQIMDDEGNCLQAGCTGEVCVQSKHSMREYYSEPQLTSETFYGTFLRTGDMGYLDDDGYLFLLGRKQDAINRSGLIFYASEVESVLERISEIEDAKVLGIPNLAEGEVPVAFVKARDGLQGSADLQMIIHSICQDNLPAYKIPKDIIILSVMPYNNAGKINRHDLLKQYQELLTL
ncbi:class I adenylate-forming enzyme family protein [Paenibacillus sp. L3-i20]|uniref:class I adenylate-forming enzyme family protein n=1 Tax=Paenibacillus sp. L3-i20 TaxID=2905833 RepID=UPI001EDE282C|nr:class I adenylate-forming enzyme family protein [Paenibacillus sp. L3-i20]GKU77240.1 acyl--CoA ligase [Paenibacillus sp. L3-i20]